MKDQVLELNDKLERKLKDSEKQDKYADYSMIYITKE